MIYISPGKYVPFDISVVPKEMQTEVIAMRQAEDNEFMQRMEEALDIKLSDEDRATTDRWVTEMCEAEDAEWIRLSRILIFKWHRRAYLCKRNKRTYQKRR